MDPLQEALALMRGDQDVHDTMATHGMGPTVEAAAALEDLDQSRRPSLIWQEVVGHPNSAPLLDHVNQQYELDQRRALQREVMERGYDLYGADFMQNPMVNVALDQTQVEYEPEVFSPVDQYLQEVYPDRPDVHQAVKGMIAAGDFDFNDPPQSWMGPHEPNMRERAQSFLMDNTSLSFPEAMAVSGNNELGVGIADLTPAGIPLWADDVYQTYQGGDTGGAALEAGLGVAMAIPGMKAATKGGGAMLRKASERWK